MILGSRVDMKFLKNTPNELRKIQNNYFMRFLTYTIIILSEYPVASQPIFSC